MVSCCAVHEHVMSKGDAGEYMKSAANAISSFVGPDSGSSPAREECRLDIRRRCF